jgi:acyl-coenzyme A synthetase/AMP-(fatty) acid ligase
MNISAPIRYHARLTPNATAIIRPDGSALSFALLDHSIERMASRALAIGLRPGDVVGLRIVGPDETLGLAMSLALARIGVAWAPWSLPVQMRKLTLHYGAGNLPDAVRFDASLLATKPAAPDALRVEMHPSGQAVCALFASSGTTGRPKHIPLSHAALLARVHATWQTRPDGRAPRIVATALDGSAGYLCALGALLQGGALVLSNPHNVAEAIERHRVRSLTTSPLSLGMILESRPEGSVPLPSLDWISVAGSRLSPQLHAITVERLCPNVTATLGSTEVGPFASAPVSIMQGIEGAAGYVWPGRQVEAVDDQDVPLPPGEFGRLRILCDDMALGYYAGQKEDTSFRDGWFYTGDIAAIGADGLVRLRGREADLINMGGVKIDPVTIESVLLSLPGILDAAAFGVPDSAGLDQVWAAIVPVMPIDAGALGQLRAHLPVLHRPATILQLKALPRNANGKIQRDVLTALARQMQSDAQRSPA